MGNRAIITTAVPDRETDSNGISHTKQVNGELVYSIENQPFGDDKPHAGIYVHWNGGRSSVEAFVTYAKLKGVRSPAYDPPYFLSRLCQIIANFFGGTTSIGITPTIYDPWDNGVYYIKDDFTILDREDDYRGEHDLQEFLLAIDSKQPEDEQLGKKKIEEYINSLKEEK